MRESSTHWQTAPALDQSHLAVMITLGIDPDSKDLALGIWGDQGPIGATVYHVKGASSNYQILDVLAYSTIGFGRKEQPSRCAIEGQQIDRRRARPRDLFKLAHVTGAAGLWLHQQHPNIELLFPTPSEWKGGVAKHAHQSRLYEELGWGFKIIGTGKGRYARPLRVPECFTHISPGQWKHVGDALLLARWAHLHKVA